MSDTLQPLPIEGGTLATRPAPAPFVDAGGAEHGVHDRWTGRAATTTTDHHDRRLDTTVAAAPVGDWDGARFDARDDRRA